MSFPATRLRRLRRTTALRSLVQETKVTPENLVKPLFIVPGSGVRREITSLPGQWQLSVDRVLAEASKSFENGIRSVLLFGIPEWKDEVGSSSWDPNGVVQKAVRELKKGIPELTVITDLCFCEYTSHGHCGVMAHGELVNDDSVRNLTVQALSHADSGVDLVAPSGMLDGAVAALRSALDERKYPSVGIMSYAVKFASAFYGPFRDAVESAPEYGDRKSYQMDFANGREALREAALDVEEGADVLMVKPALSYLDIISKVRDRFDLPVAAYNVSGEYSMVKAAASKGWIDETKIMNETLTAIKRAGADIIITYFADDFATFYKNSRA